MNGWQLLITLHPSSFILSRSGFGPNASHLLRHLFRRLGKLPGHRRGHVEHLHALGSRPIFFSNVLDMVHPAPGVGITFQVMTVAGQSAGDHDAVGAVFQGAQHRQHVQLAGAGQLDDLDRRRVLHPQPARQVGRGVGAVLAAIGDDVAMWCRSSRLLSLAQSHAIASCSISATGTNPRLDSNSASNLGHHLRIGVVHQLDRLRRAFGRARAAALADRRLDIGRAEDVAHAGQIRLDLAARRTGRCARRSGSRCICASSTTATRPPAVQRFATEHSRRARRGRLRLDHGLVQQLGVVRHARHEHAVGGEIHRAQLDVRFQEEAVGVERHLEQLGQLARRPRGARPACSTPADRAAASSIWRSTGSQT